jgi:hypothetical protein
LNLAKDVCREPIAAAWFIVRTAACITGGFWVRAFNPNINDGGTAARVAGKTFHREYMAFEYKFSGMVLNADDLISDLE